MRIELPNKAVLHRPHWLLRGARVLVGCGASGGVHGGRAAGCTWREFNAGALPLFPLQVWPDFRGASAPHQAHLRRGVLRVVAALQCERRALVRVR